MSNSISRSPSHSPPQGQNSLNWLGVMIGNSKWHWAKMQEEKLLEAWDTQHWCEQEALEEDCRKRGIESGAQIYFASVVSQQSQYLAFWPNAQEIKLTDIPIENLYATLGVDRALALLGAGVRYGWPTLVIDGGTALTLTGADMEGNLVGGAILPGIQLQLDSLGQGTAALPHLQAAQTEPPARWARSTEGAIASGVLWGLTDTLQTYIREWQEEFPASTVVLTGGAAIRLSGALGSVLIDASLLFVGMAWVRRLLILKCGRSSFLQS